MREREFATRVDPSTGERYFDRQILALRFRGFEEACELGFVMY